LESAVKRGVDLVLIQEPRGEKERDSTCSHPSFTFIKGDKGVAGKRKTSPKSRRPSHPVPDIIRFVP